MSELKPCDRCWAIVGSLEDRLKAQVTLTEEARRAPTEAAKPEAGLSELARDFCQHCHKPWGATPSAVSEAKEAVIEACWKEYGRGSMFPDTPIGNALARLAAQAPADGKEGK